MAQLHSLGTGDFSQFHHVQEIRSLSQLSYNKSNGAIQTRKIKQDQQATEDADVRNKAVSTKKWKIKSSTFSDSREPGLIGEQKPYMIFQWF